MNEASRTHTRSFTKTNSELSPRGWTAFGNKLEGCSGQVRGKREQPQSSSRQEPVSKAMLQLTKCSLIPWELRCWCLIYDSSFLARSRFHNILSISSGMSHQALFSRKQCKTKPSAEITKQHYPYPNKKKWAYHAAAKPIIKRKKKSVYL